MSEFKLQVIGADRIFDRFRRAARNIKSDTSKNLLRAGALIQRSARRKVSGDVLNVRTGQLRRSILVQKTGSGPGTIVTVAPKVKYGGIHEFGGIIKPKTKKALRFQIGGEFITVKSVRIPERPYMRPSLQENLEAITRLIGRAFKPIVT